MLVVDVDVHQGDGTHALLAADADAFTLSVNGFRNYPSAGRPISTSTSPTARVTPGTSTSSRAPSPRRSAARGPSFCFVLAGADPYEGDRLGRLALTKGGLRERDVLIRDTLAAEGVPACVTLAGGDAVDVHDTVEINVSTIRVFAKIDLRRDRACGG